MDLGEQEALTIAQIADKLATKVIEGITQTEQREKEKEQFIDNLQKQSLTNSNNILVQAMEKIDELVTTISISEIDLKTVKEDSEDATISVEIEVEYTPNNGITIPDMFSEAEKKKINDEYILCYDLCWKIPSEKSLQQRKKISASDKNVISKSQFEAQAELLGVSIEVHKDENYISIMAHVNFKSSEIYKEYVKES